MHQARPDRHRVVVIGSGFGGSTSALRLAEKGYRVGVIEAGRRFEDEDFAASTWQLRRYFWAPLVGMRGILRTMPYKDVLVGEAKLCGILTESRSGSNHPPHFVVGIGLNVAQRHFPDELVRERAVTSLALVGLEVGVEKAAAAAKPPTKPPPGSL